MMIGQLLRARLSQCTGPALAGVLTTAAVLVLGGCSGPSSRSESAGSGSTGSAFAGSQPAYHGPSWSAYLDIRPGRTCTLEGSLSAGIGGSILSRLAQTVMSQSRTTSGEVVRYRIRTASISSLPVAQGGIPPIRSTLTVPYEILNNGELGVTPSSQALGGGLQVTFRGFQLYPSIADLEPGHVRTSATTGYLTGSTAAARQQAAQMTPTGQPLRFQAAFSVSGIPAGTSIRTPAGTYHHLVAVRVALTKMTPLNARPQVKKAFSAGAGLVKVSGASRLYFARGTGLVKVYSGGVTQRLARCTG
jgi:hypothetical protein